MPQVSQDDDIVVALDALNTADDVPLCRATALSGALLAWARDVIKNVRLG